MQRTLILLKPDCVQRRLIGEVSRRFEQKGLRLVGLKLVQASVATAEKHYAVHKGKPFYDSLLKFITAGPTVAMVWEGREAVTVARTLIGATDGTKAPPATIRGDFALSVQNNVVHGSDSPENAATEIDIWFKPEELINYTPTDAAWIVAEVAMPQSEPKNPFYFLLLLASLSFAITALAYAVVPTLEQTAVEAGQKPPQSALRDALRADGWKWLLIELAAIIMFSLASMGLDRLRSLKKERAASTIAQHGETPHSPR